MKIAITGVTGFFGSSLALRLLQEGHEILALSRADPAGKRSKEALREACLGHGIDPETLAWSRLEVLNIDFRQIEATLPPEKLATIDLVWHAAAEMSYSGKKLEASFQQNVRASGQLYAHCSRHALRCQRFIYVSTAYTAGFEQTQVAESLHVAPHLINVYQASKWAAELNLAWQNQSSRLPLCIFRPSIIIGHELTGWYGGKEFGMYSIARGLFEAAAYGARTLNLEIDGAAYNNLIPINRVMDLALALSYSREQAQHCDIIHAVAERGLSIGHSLKIAGDMLGLKIALGEPKTPIDRHFAKAIALNHQFAKSSWNFETKGLKRLLGTSYQAYGLDETSMHFILSTFYKGLRPRSRLPLLASRPSRTLQHWIKTVLFAVQQSAASFGRRF